MVLKNLPPLAGLTFNCNAYPTLRVGLHSVAATRLHSDTLRVMSWTAAVYDRRQCTSLRLRRPL